MYSNYFECLTRSQPCWLLHCICSLSFHEHWVPEIGLGVKTAAISPILVGSHTCSAASLYVCQVHGEVHAVKMHQYFFHCAHLYIESYNISIVCKLSQAAVIQEVKSVLKREFYTPQLINSEVWWRETLSPTCLNAKNSTCAPWSLCRWSWSQTESAESNK